MESISEECNLSMASNNGNQVEQDKSSSANIRRSERLSRNHSEASKIAPI
jgi:hypothetical protein